MPAQEGRIAGSKLGRRCVPLVALVCAGAPAVGADLVERLAVLRLESLPTDFAYEVTGVNGTYTGDDAFDADLGVAVGVRWSLAGVGRRHGPLVGFEAAASTATLLPDGSRIGAEARGLVGYGFALDQRWTLAATLRAAWGASRLELADTDVAFSAVGTGWALQPELSAAWEPGPGWRLALAAGWRTAHAEYEDGPIAVAIDSAGPVVALGVELALPFTPPRVE